MYKALDSVLSTRKKRRIRNKKKSVGMKKGERKGGRMKKPVYMPV